MGGHGFVPNEMLSILDNVFGRWVSSQLNSYCLSSKIHYRIFLQAPRHGYRVMRSEIRKLPYLNQYLLSYNIVKSYEIDVYDLKTAAQIIIQ